MAANDDNPPPPPGLTFEEYKKTIKMDFHKPQETYPFVRLISPFKVENIIHILDKCTLFPSAGSDDEIEEGEVEFPKKHNAVFQDIFDLVETAKEKKVISPQKTSKDSENLPSSSNSSLTADCPPAFLVAYSSSPSPNVRSPVVRSPERAPDLSRKKSSSRKGSSRKSSRSPDSYRKRRSPTAHSSLRRSPKSGSRVRSSSRSHRRSRRRRSYDSRSKSPDDSYYRKREEDRRRLYKRYDSRSKSPDNAYYRKKDEDRRRRQKSRDSRSKSPDDSYYRKTDEDRRKRRKSHDSRSKSPDDAYYRKRDEDRRRLPVSHRSPIRERLSLSPSADPEDAPQKRLIKDTSPKGFPLKFRKFPVDAKDEYSTMLSEEMKRRNLLSDSDGEPDVRVENVTEAQGRNLAVATKEDSDHRETDTLQEDQANLMKYELGMVDETEKTSDAQFPQDNYFQDVKVKSEILEDKKYIIPNNYFCDLCQKALNSQVTWESHITGKKHAQKVKLQTVDEIAKGSLAIPKTPAIVSEDIPRFAGAPLGRKRFPIVAVPRLQLTIDEIRDRPIPGLDFVQEIISAMDVDYYCELCDAPCKSSSIMPHLVGFKHQLRAVREISPVFYERNKNKQGKQLKGELKSILVQHERKYGRGCIKVFSEVEDPNTRPAYDQPGPSWSIPSFPALKREKKEGEPEGGVEKDRWLDMSKGDFFCTLCDSHMNNVNMWEAHVRGKRHLANAKKIPGENISKMKSERIPNATSKLEAMIDEEFTDELVVGLDYIRETRGLNGEIYNCFLCGSCSTNFDILDHILLLKHRTRYLEQLFTDGKPNAIKDIDNLALKDNNYRVALINDECLRMLDEHGRGRVEVYQTKN